MTDRSPTAFIIRVGPAYLCPVCGYDGTFKGNHYSDDEGGCIGSGICASCLFEPGFDDSRAASAGAGDSIAQSIRAYRNSWLAAGAPWRGGQVKPLPIGWNAQAQLAELCKAAPFLFE